VAGFRRIDKIINNRYWTIPKYISYRREDKKYEQYYFENI
jgi:hypothetical protein